MSTPVPAAAGLAKAQALAGRPRDRDRDRDGAGVAPEASQQPSRSDTFSAARAVTPAAATAAGAALQGGSTAWRSLASGLGATAGDGAAGAAVAGAKARAKAGVPLISASAAEKDDIASGSAAIWAAASGAVVQSSSLFAGMFGGQALGARAPVVPAPAPSHVPSRSGRPMRGLIWESVEEVRPQRSNPP